MFDETNEPPEVPAEDIKDPDDRPEFATELAPAELESLEQKEGSN